MRVLHLLKESPNGNGAAHMAVDLACEQVKLGHDVMLLSANSAFDQLLTRNGVLVGTIPRVTDARSAARSLVALARAVRGFRPDVLHAHMRSSAVLGAAIAAVTRTVLVTTVHNSYDPHLRLMGLGRLAVAVSEAERTLLLDHGFPPGRTGLVLNGTGGSPRLARRPIDDPIGAPQVPSIISVGGLHRRKAVDDVITAFALASSDAPGWHLNIVGDGANRQALEEQAARLHLSDSVHFLGSVVNPMPLLQQSAVFVTGTLADPCPLAVIEARTAGCALIGTVVGGVPEILEHGRAGRLVPPRDPKTLATELKRLMQSPAELRHWQDAALLGAERLSAARMATQYDEAYRSVLPARRRRRASVGSHTV